MKALAFFFVILLSSLTSAQSQSLTRIGGGGGSTVPTVRYPMKLVNPESVGFKSIFADVSVIAAKRAASKTPVTIIQTLKPGFFLAETSGSKTIALELPGRALADETKLMLHIENSDQLHSYENTLGSLSTVAIFKLIDPKQRFTHARFLAALKRGETYTIRRGTGTEKKHLLVVWE